jgi:hypothetical protein
VQKPYEILRGVIPADYLEKAREETLRLKNWILNNGLLDTPSELGSGNYWRGIETASRISPILHELYTSDFMKSIVSNYMEEAWLFNDQIVVKMPGEPFEFPPHRDNQYCYSSIHQVNFAWILDDITEENGGFQIQGKEVKLNAGDILVLDGNTVHSSGRNFSTEPRRNWACVYTTGSTNFKKFFSERFI